MAASTDSTSSQRSSSDSSSLGPIELFDRHLKLLSDSYLAFFNERAKIEEVYIDSLLRLHRRCKAIDTFLDDRFEPTSARHAWYEVRDNIEREAQTRQAFLSTLTVDAIQPLMTLREIQDRTRKRIKEDIKESTSAYNDYAENVLSRFKRNYMKKCQEVEEYKASSTPVVIQTPYNATDLTLTSVSQSSTNSSIVSPVSSPQPLRPLTRRASGHQPLPRNRSPSTSTALQDLAQQGKKQLNQLKTFLDNKGGTVKEGLGSGRSDTAIRNVRAKREADEADKEYRKGVHWLETLRLRRIKIIEGGFKSLQSFVQESGEGVKSVLAKYTDNMIATTTTQTQLSTHARSLVDCILPQKDVSIIAPIISRYMHQTIPQRTCYANYHFGECNDLMFGVGLVDYVTSRGLVEGSVPKIICICIEEIEKRGLHSEGIYRVSGRHAIVQDLIHKVEKDEEKFQFTLTDDIFAIGSLLKQYLRELPEPVFKYPLEERIKHAEDIHQHNANEFIALRARIRRLPSVHQASLKAILEHLSSVAAHSEKNKMDAKNLAIIFGSVIFGEDDLPKNGDLLAVHSLKDTVMEDLILNVEMLFEDRAVHLASPPLPPTPIQGHQSLYGYGSSYTQIATVPPNSEQSSATPNDFSPQLPSGPSHSIHPSRRIQLDRDSDHDDDQFASASTVSPINELNEVTSGRLGVATSTEFSVTESKPSEPTPEPA